MWRGNCARQGSSFQPPGSLVLTAAKEEIAYRLIKTVNGVDSKARNPAYKMRWNELVTDMEWDPPGA